MKPFLFFVLACLVLAVPVAAQDDTLAVAGVSVETREDVYGQVAQFAVGQVVNGSGEAYTNLALLAEVYDAADALVGEGFGYLVNACGAGLLPDAAIQPGAAQPFEVRLELFTPDAQVARIEIVPQGSPTEATPPEEDPASGIHRISGGEVVDVQWVDSKSLRYGIGCTRDVFTELRWFHHSLRTGETLPVQHPNTDDLTPALLRRLSLDDPAMFDISAITFAPGGDRVIYQDDINRIFSAEPDGQFVRNLYTTLYNRTLQGIYWLPGGNSFLAYYYGAYGDPVLYFTADEEGRAISLNPQYAVESDIVPGVSPDGRRAVIAGTIDGTTGYFQKALINQSPPQLLFEAQPAGNNYPAPLWGGSNATRQTVYLAMDVDGEPRLQCFDTARGGPFDLAPLPFDVATEERARWWMSPDGDTIALAANGVHGGLWLIDLTTFPACGE